MPGAIAEVIDLEAARQLRQERYAQSHSALEAMAGELALRETVTLGEAGVQRAFADFASGAREMLRTDEEFAEVLDIDDKRSHRVVGGLARDKDGVPMVEIVSNGRRVAESTARFRPEFRPQFVRDSADVTTAETADALRPGESWVALSMPPMQELDAYPEIYKNKLGYRENLAYIQWYAKADEHTLWAGSFSVDLSDAETWQTLLAEEGVEIPPGESVNTWILHGIKQQLNPEQTEQYVRSLRDRYYQRRGFQGKRYSVSEYVAANSDVMEKIFMSYYPSLAEAASGGANNEVMQGLAASMLQVDLSKMKAGVRRQLLRVANSRSFDGEMVDSMDALIRYVAVEELRTGLPALVGGQTTQSRAAAARRARLLEAPVDSLNQHLSYNLQAGLLAGRAYGGCAGQVQLSEDIQNALANSPQEAYGGRNRGSEGVGEISMGNCVIASCPNHEKVVKVGGCGVCLIRCQRLFNKGIDPAKMKAQTGRAPADSRERQEPVVSLESKRQEKRLAQERRVAELATVAA